MKRVILTGATGFIGSHLVYKLLEEEYEVGILCRDKSNLKNLNSVIDKIKVYRVDGIIEKIIEAFNEFTPKYIVHLAAFFTADHNKDDIDNLINSNIKYPTVVLEAMKHCQIKYIINIGTAWQHYNNEDYNPMCLYAATKESFEKIIDYYVKALDFKCITLSLFDSYGDNDERGKLITLLKDFSIKNKEIDMTPGESKIDLTHIDDITSGIVKGLEYLNCISNGEHRKYALCTGRLLTLKDVVEIFNRQTGYKLEVNWGKRNYRVREIMEPWKNYEKLPNWESKITFEEGIKMIYK